MAVDGRDNLYIADTANGRVLKETLSGSLYTESTIADRAGYVLESPRGVAVDAGGNVYISDIGNDDVVKETLAYGGYHVSTIAGPETGLYFPFSVAVDALGNVFIADYDHSRIVMETPFANRYSQSIVPSSPLALPNRGSGRHQWQRLHRGHLQSPGIKRDAVGYHLGREHGRRPFH